MIQLAQCYDLTDTRYTHELPQRAAEFVDDARRAGVTIPKNQVGSDLLRRRFDCAVVNWALARLESKNEHYRSVRCLFIEGQPVYVDPQDAELRTAIALESHVQVAVRDPTCILGVFRPT